MVSRERTNEAAAGQFLARERSWKGLDLILVEGGRRLQGSEVADRLRFPGQSPGGRYVFWVYNVCIKNRLAAKIRCKNYKEVLSIAFSIGPARKGLSRAGAWLLSVLAERGRSTFSTGVARDVLSEGPYKELASKGAVTHLLFSLLRRGWIKRLQNGLYAIVPLEAGPDAHWSVHPWLIGEHLAQPYMLSHWTAADYHGLTDQLPRAVFLSTTHRLRNRTIGGTPFYFIYRPPEKFFGATEVYIDDHRIFVADPERTVLDCLGHQQYSGGFFEAAKIAYEAIAQGVLNWDKVLTYAHRLHNGAVIKRLGWLIEFFELPCPEHVIADLRRGLSTGYVLLDTGGATHGRHVLRWRVRVNVDPDALRRSVLS